MYYRRADGVLVEQTASDGALPELPEGAARLTAKEYKGALKEVEAARREHAAALTAQDEERARGDYEALRAAGIPEGTARRLTGYAGADGEGDG